MSLEVRVPIAELYLTSKDMADSFPLIWAIFNQFKAKVLYAESSFTVEYGPPQGDKGITFLIVYTTCDEEVEDSLDAYLRDKKLGNYDGHKLRITDTGQEITAVRWTLEVRGDQNESR